MSDYTYMDVEGDVLRIAPSTQVDGMTLLMVEHPNKLAGMHVANTDAPTVALELLKAAGQESVLVPKVESPVRPSGSGGELIECGHGARKVTVHREDSADKLREKAANYIALAEHVESTAAREAAEKAETEAAAKKLQERRDALARELGYTHSWDRAKFMFQKAVDQIIDLEDKLEAANAIEDANARVALAHADALNAAADAFGKDAWQDALIDAVDDVTATQGMTAWMRERARAIEVGTI